MIQIKITDTLAKDGFFDKTTYEITGHAGYAEKGFDVVCAGVSAIYEFFKLFLSKAKNYGVTKEYEEGVEIELKSLMISNALTKYFTLMQENYPQYVEVVKSIIIKTRS